MKAIYDALKIIQINKSIILEDLRCVHHTSTDLYHVRDSTPTITSWNIQPKTEH